METEQVLVRGRRVPALQYVGLGPTKRIAEQVASMEVVKELAKYNVHD